MKDNYLKMSNNELKEYIISLSKQKRLELFSKLLVNKKYQKALIVVDFLNENEIEELKLNVYLHMKDKHKINSQIPKVEAIGLNTKHSILWGLLMTQAKNKEVEKMIIECLNENDRVINIIINSLSIPEIKKGHELAPQLTQAMEYLYFNKEVIDFCAPKLRRYSKFIHETQEKSFARSELIRAEDLYKYVTKFLPEHIKVVEAKKLDIHNFIKSFDVVFKTFQANRETKLTPSGYINTATVREILEEIVVFNPSLQSVLDNKVVKQNDYYLIELAIEVMKENKCLKQVGNKYVFTKKQVDITKMHSDVIYITYIQDLHTTIEAVMLFTYIVLASKRGITNFKISALIELVYCNLRGFITNYENDVVSDHFEDAFISVLDVFEGLGADVIMHGDDFILKNFAADSIVFPLFYSMQEQFKDVEKIEDIKQVPTHGSFSLKYEKVAPRFSQTICIETLYKLNEDMY